MNKICISTGDFLKNAGLVGLKYLLDESDANEDIDYGITDDKQGIWIKQEFAANADWTDMYVKAFVKYYSADTVYQRVLDKIDYLLITIQNGDWKPEEVKDDLKFINEKLLSNSYKSGFENMKDKIEHPETYIALMNSKLKEKMSSEELLQRLQELKQFLVQPLCKETFCMKSIIYNYINRFWDGKSFLLRTNAAKDLKETFHADFSEPFQTYIMAEHGNAKDQCIDCERPISTKEEKISIAFLKDQADDLSRKKSAFWNCKVDAYLCPICAFVYSLIPLGFSLVGNNFVFININANVEELLRANSKEVKVYEAERQENEKYSSWVSRTIDILLDEKMRELGNIQVITRGRDEKSTYTFEVVGKDALIILSEKGVQKNIKRLSEHPYIKVGREYWNIHESTVMNILGYRNQYANINKILKMALDLPSLVIPAWLLYDIQLRTSLIKKEKGEKENDKKIGGALMNRYEVRESGYKLRNTLLTAKGTEDPSCLRGTVYQLLNALSVGNVTRFMDIIMRVYCSTKLQVPDAFIELLRDGDRFFEYGYAFVLGLQGSHYVKKEDNENE